MAEEEINSSDSNEAKAAYKNSDTENTEPLIVKGVGEKQYHALFDEEGLPTEIRVTNGDETIYYNNRLQEEELFDISDEMKQLGFDDREVDYFMRQLADRIV
ncbi:MAG: hypothetical protein V1838_04720 [Patescibacteria group bacterium]